ncbi:hypothetical protein BOO86_03085 [Mycobacterium sp. CBMA 234]|nr:hypothetical protein [Mycolicibacterium sp. CBMA 234]
MSGTCTTCAANAAGIDGGADTDRLNSARLPHTSMRARSASSSTPIDDSRRPGSAAIATNTCSSRLARSATSRSEKWCPAPNVLMKSLSPRPEKMNPNPPTKPELLIDAEAGMPPKSNEKASGKKSMTTRSAGGAVPPW